MQKNELRERETTIKDKDIKIYELKKKTQDLEKFKFVLDYKIKELRREIGPRESTISELNEQTTKMTQEVKHYKRVNNNLTLIVADLKLRQEGLQSESHKLREVIKKQEDYKKQFTDDLYETLNNIKDYKKLKKGVVRLYTIYVKEKGKSTANEGGETDIHNEQHNKRKWLEGETFSYRALLQKD